jgi:hypothetical protein
MKGNSETAVVLVTLTMILFLLATASGLLNKTFGEKGLLEKYSLKGITESFVEASSKKFMDQNQAFLDSVSTAFTGDKLPQKCSSWYQQCTGKTDSPWNNKPYLTESDYDTAMAGIKCDNAPAIKEIADMWATSDSTFSQMASSDSSKIVLVRNACKINLIDQIHKQQPAISGD